MTGCKPPGYANSVANADFIAQLADCFGNSPEQSHFLDTKQSIGEDLIVYPKPFNDGFNLNFNSTMVGEAVATVFSATGQSYHCERFDCSEGKNTWQINMGGKLPAGSFILKFELRLFHVLSYVGF